MENNSPVNMQGGGRAKRAVIVFAACLALAFICITIVSRCSFLYKFNDWVDVNWYLSVGHGMAEGLVPYKDLFEQKGLLLYAIFAVNYIIFGNAFWGIYILEIACAAAFLFVCYKILRLYLSYAASLGMLVLIAMLTYTCAGMLQSGGAVEEYCLPMLAFGLYVFLSCLKRGGGRVPLWQIALCGLFSGIIFWMKYATLSFYAVFAVIYFVDRCIQGDVKGAFIAAGCFLAAFAVPAVTCLIYLGVNGAIDEMAEVYIYRNIFTYGGTGGEFWERIADTLICLARHSYLYAVAVTGVVYVFKRTDMPLRHKVYCAVLVGGVSLIQIICGKHLQYHYPVVVFLPFGLYAALVYIKQLFAFIKSKLPRKKQNAPQGDKKGGAVQKLKIGVNVHTGVICAIAAGVFCLIFGNSTLALFIYKDYPQLAIAQKLEELSGGEEYVLYTYRVGDAGFYNACDVAPQYYFFAANDFSRESYPEMYESMEGYVRERSADYIITQDKYYEEDYYLFAESGYTEIGRYSYIRIKDNFTFHHMTYILLAK